MSPATVLALRPKAEALAEHTSRTDTLAKLEQALALLREVATIQEAKQIHDVVKAVRVYAREQKLGREVEGKAKAVTFEALWQIGKLLHETERNTGTRGQLVGPGVIGPSNIEGPIGPPPTLAELGIDYKTSFIAQKLFALPQDVFEQIRDGHTTLDKMEADAKRDATRAAKDQALIDVIAQRGGPAADLRVCSCAELFASGIRPDAVVTEPPGGAEHLSAFSELSYACREVPLVAVKLARAVTPFLPEVMKRLCEHLRFWDIDIRGPELILKFCQEPGVLQWERSNARLLLDGTMFHPYKTQWDEYFVQRLSAPGALVCDPFLSADTAIAALVFGRRFVGCSLDAGVVEDTRRQIGAGQ